MVETKMKTEVECIRVRIPALRTSSRTPETEPQPLMGCVLGSAGVDGGEKEASQKW